LESAGVAGQEAQPVGEALRVASQVDRETGEAEAQGLRAQVVEQSGQSVTQLRQLIRPRLDGVETVPVREVNRFALRRLQAEGAANEAGEHKANRRP